MAPEDNEYIRTYVRSTGMINLVADAGKGTCALGSLRQRAVASVGGSVERLSALGAGVFSETRHAHA